MVTAQCNVIVLSAMSFFFFIRQGSPESLVMA